MIDRFLTEFARMRPSFPVGLENFNHQCVRITVNWRCHFDCEFCYVPPLIRERKRAFGKVDPVLDTESFRRLTRLYFRHIRRIYEEEGWIVPFSLSFCASDPARDPEVQIELFEVAKEELMREFRHLSEEEAENLLPPTIILDIHAKGAFERYLNLLKKVRSVWKYGFIWFSSTLWIDRPSLSEKEVERHYEAHRAAWSERCAFFSILTPGLTDRYSWKDLLGVAQQAFEVICHSRQMMATINVTVPLKGTLKIFDVFHHNFVEFFDAFSKVNILAFADRYDWPIHDGLEEAAALLEKTPRFRDNPHYLVSEIGLIPGLAKALSQGRDGYINPIGFGCFPTIGCYLGIFGIEPSGIISACQFGHDPIEKRAQDLSDFEEVVYSPERLRNLRMKIEYPFWSKKCPYKRKDCADSECSTFSRGSCPVDLFFENRSYRLQAKSCTALTAAMDRMLQNIRQGLRMNPAEFSYRTFTDSVEVFQTAVAPEILEARLGD